MLLLHCILFFLLEEEDDDDSDPGILIIYSPDQQIHQVLALPAVAAIPYLQQGKFKKIITKDTI